MAGHVKTRLTPFLEPVEAAELHRAFVADMLAKLNIFAGSADIELHTDRETDAWPKAWVTRRLQCAGSLELKMLHAFKSMFTEGRTQAMIVGSDAPTLPVEHLEALLRSDADVAFGPADDGGYYAVMCRRFHPKMLADVRWSSKHALGESAAAASACGLSVGFGPVWFDIDEPADLSRLLSADDLPPHTREWKQRFRR